MNKIIGMLLGCCLSWAASCAMAQPATQSGLLLKHPAEQSLFLNAAMSLLVAVLFLGLACFVLLWLRRRIMPNVDSHNEYVPVVKTTRRITPKTTLVTVIWQGKAYLLAESQGAISVLDSVPKEATAP